MTQVEGSAEFYRCEDELLDGRRVTVRSINPEDKAFLQNLMRHLSPRSRYYRFLSPKKNLSDKELVFFSDVDFDRHVALVACLYFDGREVPVGTGRYIINEQNTLLPGAELSFAVQDEFQGFGVATILLKHLIIIARVSGVEEFVGVMLSDNVKMLKVLQHSGLSMTLCVYDE